MADTNPFSDPNFGADLVGGTKNPFADPDFGKPRSALGEIGSQIKAGVVAELPQQLGQALQYASEPGNPVYEYGKGVAERAKARGEQPEYVAHPEDHNAVTNAFAGGGRMLAPSIAAPAAVGLAATALPVTGPVAAGIGATLGVLPSAFQQGQQTLDKAHERGVPDEVAIPAARQTAAIEGAGEMAGNLIGARVLGAFAKPTLSSFVADAVKKGASAEAATAAGVAKGLTDETGIIKPWLQHTAEGAIAEPATEYAQQYGESAVEKAAGIDTQDPHEAGLEVIPPTLGMVGLMTPLGLAGHAIRHALQTKPGAAQEPPIPTQGETQAPENAAPGAAPAPQTVPPGEAPIEPSITTPDASTTPEAGPAGTPETPSVLTTEPAGPITRAAEIAVGTGAAQAAQDQATQAVLAGQQQEAAQAQEEAVGEATKAADKVHTDEERDARKAIDQLLTKPKEGESKTKFTLPKASAALYLDAVDRMLERTNQQQGDLYFAGDNTRAEALGRELDYLQKGRKALAKLAGVTGEQAKPKETKNESESESESPVAPTPKGQSVPAATVEQQAAPAAGERNAADVNAEQPAAPNAEQPNATNANAAARGEATAATGVANGEAESGKPAEKGSSRVLTDEAKALLTSVDAGGTPAFISKNLRKIATDNGVNIEKSDTPADVIGRLRAVEQKVPEQEPAGAQTGTAEHFISARGPWDFERTFPSPHDYERHRAGAPGILDQAEVEGETRADRATAIASIFGEQRSEALNHLGDINALQTALRTNIDPRTGKQPKNLLRARKEWTDSLAQSETQYQGAIDAVGEYFPQPAVDAFKAHVEKVFAANEIDSAAHEAATSPQNEIPHPTAAQAEAGNYAKGHVQIGGLDISIENPEGSQRSNLDTNALADVKLTGSAQTTRDSALQMWRSGDLDRSLTQFKNAIAAANLEGMPGEAAQMQKLVEPAWVSTVQNGHYGYFKGTVGKDGDHVDTFVKPGTAADYSGNVYVVDQQGKAGGFDEHKVMIGYPSQLAARQAYSSNYPKGFKVGPVTATTMPELKTWLASGDTKAPFSETKAPKPETTAAPAPLITGSTKEQHEAAVAWDRSMREGQPETITLPMMGKGPDYRGVPSAEIQIQQYKDGKYAFSAHFQTNVNGGGGPLIRHEGGPAYDSRDAALRAAIEQGRRFAEQKGAASEASNTAHLKHTARLSTWLDTLARPKSKATPQAPAIPGTSPLGAKPTLAERNRQKAEEAAQPEVRASEAADSRFAKNTIFTSDAVAAARARIKSKMGRLSAGIDPEMMQDGITIAGAYIEAGIRDFAGFTAQMVADFGDAIKPYLRSFYEGVRHYPGLETQGMTPSHEIDSVVAAPTMEPEAPRGKPAAEEKPAADVVQPRVTDGAGAAALEGVPSGEIRDIREGGDARTELEGGGESYVAGDAGRPFGGLQPTGILGHGEPALHIPETGVKPPGEIYETPRNFVITDDLNIGKGGAVQKYNDNVAAIKLLKQLEAESRQATAAEQATLAKYVGWGGIKQVFPKPGSAAPQGWSARAAEIRELLTPEEHTAAARSIQDAHYTSMDVVDASWLIARRLGFDGGKVLEDSMGVGNFFGRMPVDLRDTSSLTGVELDSVTARIAKQLYPQANILGPIGFHEVTLADEHNNLNMGNPPFGNQQLYDPTAKHLQGFSIHNYFFAKAIDKLAPGGLHIQVVSRYLMDAKDTTARGYIAHRAELVGAIRLPWTTFKENANTEVITDIVILQKLPQSKWGSANRSWVETAEMPDPTGKEPMTVNRYFVDNPEMIVGQIERSTMVPGGSDITVQPNKGEDLAHGIARAIGNLPTDIYWRGKTEDEVQTEVGAAVEGADEHDVGAFFEQDGKVYRRVATPDGSVRAEEITPNTPWSEKQQWGESRIERLRGMVGLRSAARELLKAEAHDESKLKLDSLRARLNTLYDKFQAKYGYLNDQANERVFHSDPDTILLALEDKYDRGVTPARAKTLGVAPREPSAEKMPIFRQRVVMAHEVPTHVESVRDAVTVSLHERGGVAVQFISDLTGKSTNDVIGELTSGESPIAFMDPATQKFALAAEYLSGNVKKKYAEARAAGLTSNADALKAVFPPDLKAGDIRPRLGAPWIDSDAYRDFAKHLFGPSTTANIQYIPATGGFAVNIAGGNQAMLDTRWGVQSVDVVDPQTGAVRTIRDGRNGADILTRTLNSRELTVWHTDTEGNRYSHPEITQALAERAAEMHQEFENFAFADLERRERLVNFYNDNLNTSVDPKIDGSYLELPGKVPDAVISFRRSQKDAVARIIRYQKALLDHVVGAGKTFTAIAGAMEQRRLGLKKKPMIVVPNHLVKQWSTAFYQLYPGAKILAMKKADFEKINRRRMLARVATGDYDAVIFSHSSFGFIPNEKQLVIDHISRQVEEIQQAIDIARETEGKKSKTAAQYQKQKERLQERLKRIADAPRDNILTFQELGVDMLYVDESQEYKNLFFTTGKRGVGGFGNPSGSKRAFDMFIKTKWLQDANAGNGVAFLTGTPISNSLTELYTLQRYLGLESLEERGLRSLDAWLNTFGVIESEYEANVTGTRYKRKERLRRLTNVPEAMQMYKQFADSISLADIKRNYAEDNGGADFPVPTVKGGKPRQNITVEPSAAQREFSIQLQDRMERLTGDVRRDNALKILGDGRKAALDMRLVDRSQPDNPTGKTHTAADQIKRIYDENASRLGTQLVFLDLSTPIKHGKKDALAYLKKARELLQSPGAYSYGTLTHQWDGLREALIERMQTVDENDDGEEDRIGKLEQFLAQRDDIDAAVSTADSGFSVYDDLRQKLIDRDIPAKQIAFIHDYNTENQKQDLFDQVNAGTIRVLMGSTSKMGAGTNVQRKAVALHHLDVPWRPSDIEQREGRIVRQGNEFRQADSNFQVEIMAYATVGTSDVFFWQTQEQKLNGINSLRNFKGEREIEEVSADAMSAAEMKALASGNPLILEDVSLTDAVRKLEATQRRHISNQQDLESQVAKYRRQIDGLPKIIEDQTALVDKISAYNADPFEGRPAPTVEVDGKAMTAYEAREHVREAMHAAEQVAATKNAPATARLAAILEERRAIEQRLMRENPKLVVANDHYRTNVQVNKAAEKDAGWLKLQQEREQLEKAQARPELGVTIGGKVYHSSEGAVKGIERAAGDISPFRALLHGQEFIRRDDAAAFIDPIVKAMQATGTGSTDLGTIAGIPIHLEWVGTNWGRGVEVNVGFAGHTALSGFVDDRAETTHVAANPATGSRVLHRITGLMSEARIDRDENRRKLKTAQEGIAPVSAQVGRPWGKEDELAAKRARLTQVRSELAQTPTAQQATALTAEDLNGILTDDQKSEAADAADVGEWGPEAADYVVRSYNEWVRHGRPTDIGAEALDLYSSIRAATNPQLSAELAAQPRGSGISGVDVQAVLAGFMRKYQLRGLPKVNILPRWAWPFKNSERIKDAIAVGGTVRGAYWRGEVYLDPSALATKADALFVLKHELQHHGLKVLIPDSAALQRRMALIYDHNANVRELADVKMRELGYDKARAAEEALADLAGDGKWQAVKGWRLLFAQVREALRKMGFKIGFTDADVAALISSAQRVVTERQAAPARATAATATQGAALSVELPNDTPAAQTQRAHSAIFEGSRNFLSDILRSDRFMNRLGQKWHTPAHIAETQPAFAPVYRSAQDYLHELNSIARDAQMAARNLMVTIESFKDFGKKSARNADVRAAHDALMYGTLYGGGNPMEGERWTHEELRTGRIQVRDKQGQFTGMTTQAPFAPMNDEQIKLHDQALDSIGVSLNEYAKSLIWRNADLKGLALDKDATRSASIDQVAATVKAGADEKITELRFQQAQSTDDKVKARIDAQVADWQSFSKEVDSITDKTMKLLQHGYFPAMRFGDYAVNVQRLDDSGKWHEVAFHRFDSQFAANRARREIAAEHGGKIISKTERPTQPGVYVVSDKMNTDAHRLFNGLNLDALQVFAEHIRGEDGLPISGDPLMQQYFRLALSERSALKQHIHRKGTPGWSTDVGRVLANFTTSHAASSSRNYFAGKMLAATQDIKGVSGDLYQYATNYVKYLQDPNEESHGLRSFLANYYILGSLAFGAVNMTQPVLITAPFLTKWTGYGDAIAKLGAASLDYTRGKRGANEQERADYAKAVAEGIVAPQEIHQIRADTQASTLGDSRTYAKLEEWAQGAGVPLPSKLFMRKASFVWGSIYSMTEQFNRSVTFLAALRIAREKGIENPYDFAVQAVSQTQFTYNRANRPEFSRGPIGSVLMTFKTFNIAYFELFQRLMKLENKKPAAVMMATLFALAGSQGLPLAEDFEDLLDTIGQWMGYSTNTQKSIRQWMERTLGPNIANIMLHGVSGVPGVPIDVASRMGMQNLIPGSALLKTSEPDSTRDILEAMGPAASLFQNLKTATQSVATGEFNRLETLAPVSVQNVLKGADMLQAGQYRDLRDRKVVDTTPADAAFKMVGFQPAVVAQASRVYGQNQQDLAQHKVVEDSIVLRLATAIVDSNPELRAKAMADWQDWNKKNPEMIVRLTPSQIQARVKNMTASKEQRQVKSAPREVRGEIAESFRPRQ